MNKYTKVIAEVLRREHLKGDLDFDKIAIEIYKAILPLNSRKYKKNDNIQVY